MDAPSVAENVTFVPVRYLSEVLKVALDTKSDRKNSPKPRKPRAKKQSAGSEA